VLQQCVALSCSVLQCIAVDMGRQEMTKFVQDFFKRLQSVAVCCSELQSVAVCCSGYGAAKNAFAHTH